MRLIPHFLLCAISLSWTDVTPARKERLAWDVTLIFRANNWGYIRRLAPKTPRKGGYGLYYHIDMNGGPWNDRWVNTTTIPKLREQFSLAYYYNNIQTYLGPL